MILKPARIALFSFAMLSIPFVVFGLSQDRQFGTGIFDFVFFVRLATILLAIIIITATGIKKRKEILSLFSGGKKSEFMLYKPILPSFYNNNFKGIKGIVFSPYIKVFFLTLLTFFFFYHLWNQIAVMIIRMSGNQYVYLADSFLHGKLDISVDLIDTVHRQDRIYSLFPPFPAILLVPFVAFFGVNINIPLLSTAIFFVSALLLIEILKKLKVKRGHILWLVIAFFWGTGYWFILMSSDGVWFFAHMIAVLMTFLAINEVLGKGRGLLVGLFIGAAFLSRQLCAYGIIFLIIPLIRKQTNNKSRIANVFSLLVGFGFAAIVYLGYNWLRFGNMFDTGYSYLPFGGFHSERISKYGQFSPAFLPFNLMYMFVQGFHAEFQSYGWLTPTNVDQFGTSLLWASPFIIFSLWGKWKGGFRIACWIAICAALIHQLLYFNNGWMQNNMQRFTLDFLPLLFLLIALGIKRFPAYIWKATIVVAVSLNIITFFIAHL
jgi:hypothetical protein